MSFYYFNKALKANPYTWNKGSQLPTLLLFIILSYNLSAQNSPVPNQPPEYILAHIDESQLSLADPITNSDLQNVLDQYNVLSYEIAFPGADTIPGAGYLTFSRRVELANPLQDAENLKVALEQTGIFDLVELVYEPKLLETVSPCSSPVPISDPNSANPNYLELMDFPCAWTITEGDPNITVGITDRLFDPSHPDLLGKVVTTKGEYQTGSQDDHGYATAGAVAALHNTNCVAGAGNKTKVVGYSIGISGIWNAFKEGNKVINCSWVFPVIGEQIKECIRVVASRTPIVFGGCGNSAASIADIPGIIIVGRLNENLNYVPYGGDCGAFEENVDIGVPAHGTFQSHMWQLDADGTCRENFGGTTSIAAPVVSGAIGLMYAVNPCLSPMEVEEILKLTANPIPNVDEWDGVDAGALNAYEAVLAAANLSGNNSDITISSIETWDSPTIMNGNVTIQSGAVLTITSTLRFDGALDKIIVKPGGKLIVDGGILLNGCTNSFWDGIEVEGNPALSQFGLGNQGEVELVNGAQIHNAKIGVSLHKRHPYATGGGGILIANGAKFINNQLGISFANYENFLPVGNNPTYYNRSSISNCTFTHDEKVSLFPFDFFEAHISFYRVSGISVHHCRFEDERGYVANESLLGSGIYTLESQVLIKNSHFKGMLFGINAASVNSIRTFSVRNSEFEGNFMGVNVRGVNVFTVEDCAFTRIGDFPFTQQLTSFEYPDRHVGMFIDQSTGFFVQKNTFTGFSTVDASVDIGVCVRNTNIDQQGNNISDINRIRNNEFGTLDISTLANKVNQGSNFLGGMVYNCNDYYFSFGNAISVIDGSIANFQTGANNLAAGNTFPVFTSNTLFKDINNTTGNVLQYFYAEEETFEEPISFPVGRVIKIPAARNTCENEVGSDQIPGDKYATLKNRLVDSEVAFLELHTQYNNLIDGGNTGFLVSSLSTISPVNKELKKAELLSYSPYLSKKVLSQILSITVFSNADKMEILSANPDALKQSRFLAEAKTTLSLSPVEAQALDTATLVLTDRSDLERRLASSLSDLHDLSNIFIRHILSDSTSLAYDSIQSYLNKKHSLEAAYMKVDAYLEAGQSEAAMLELHTIPPLFDFDPIESDHHQLYLEWVNWWVTHQGNYFALEEEDWQPILQIAESGDSQAAMKAQNILNLLGAGNYQHEPILMAPSYMTAPEEQVQTINPDRNGNLVTAYPNPTHGHTIFQFELPGESQSGTLIIQDFSGRIIKAIPLEQNVGRVVWNTDNQQPGVYFYHIQYEHKKGPLSKLILVK